MKPTFEIKELQRRTQTLAEDLLARSQELPDVDEKLHAAWREARDGGRTAASFEAWRDDWVDQVAVAWVLGCVFVRYLEDNGLIEDVWLAGEGSRAARAEEAQEGFFREHPELSDREYLEHVFRAAGACPATRELFADGRTPIWDLGPSGDGAMALLKFWREVDPETGLLKRSFAGEDGDTRFLGDLYQELSEAAKKKYALLQTPDFVEAFILDHTLEPALAEFGLETVRMIDPTCGSGHFLLGTFHRLFERWQKQEPGGNPVVLAQRALDAVHGVDVNPFAVAIARFRLILAAIHVCGLHRLAEAPGWKLNLAVGDSLLHGAAWDPKGVQIGRGKDWFGETEEEVFAEPALALEDSREVRRILGQPYHAVVGNPPYITVKDKALGKLYRERFNSCHRQYALVVPFVERFFQLCASDGGERVGHVGMIVANSFMKREFGKKLIEEFLPTVELETVIDTSGAYIPGHGTPTVILFGRNRKAIASTVRAVLGIRGEPKTPDDPAQGFVWSAILEQLDKPGSESEFVSVAEMERELLGGHPWSLTGGGAVELKDRIESCAEKRLGDIVDSIGFASFPGLDDAFVMDQAALRRKDTPATLIKEFVVGECVRDWAEQPDLCALAPYDENFELVPLEKDSRWGRHLWTMRTCLNGVVSFGGKTRAQLGEDWWGWYRWVPKKYRTPLSIAFAFVATHNHFVLDRGGKVFKQSAPVIKLPPDATEDDHLALLGLLNSSVACFWMKQVFYPKASSTGDISIEKGKPEDNRYEIAGTGLQNFPVPEMSEAQRERLIGLTAELDRRAREASSCHPNEVIRGWNGDDPDSLRGLLADARSRYEELQGEMVALQEDLDWHVYSLFGLAASADCASDTSDSTERLTPEARPFIWSGEHPNASTIHRARFRALKDDKNLRMLEDIVFKRRWLGRQGVFGHGSGGYDAWTQEALRAWLLDRLEAECESSSKEPSPASCAELASQVSGITDFNAVASIFRDRTDFDTTSLVAELVADESVPFLPTLRYKAPGLRNRQIWERTWELQRAEDRGESLGDIPVPPKYKSGDFLKQDYWRLRGKLDVPKERFISFPHCERDGDPTLVVLWAGYDHLQQARAIAAYYQRMKDQEGWSPERLQPLLAGLDQLVPWLLQWHNELDPEFGLKMGEYFQTFLETEARELGFTLEQMRGWEPPKKTRGRKKKAAKK